ncbi:hypothetical protein [Cytobacillus oceanisediminis]|uniref:hypothetical protein n=1 Tax=Cytobacillus oceanisediminis TaxID=665099 RepID=UPI001FB4C8BF|nr:hypothetical protein [Cytobacillus oceanisediminis]UOE57995.1 hypothetical protein IRB79_27390 [Cytobacillus oceanisediminis]
MNLEGKRVCIKKDIGVSGVPVGSKGTVQFVFLNEFFPVQLELDEPDSDGHHVYRVGLGDIGEITEEGQKEKLTVIEPEHDWLSVNAGEDIPI